MSPNISHVSSKIVKRLKRLATAHKKQSGLNHANALDFIAQQHGFNHWHHVTICEKRMKSTELTYSEGVFVIFGSKEGADVLTDNNDLVEDYHLFGCCKQDLLDRIGNSIDEDDPNGRTVYETNPKEDIVEWMFDEFSRSHFFKVSNHENITSITDVLKVVSKYSFWPPEIIFMSGNMFNNFDDSACDEDGNIVGLQLLK